jgi:hypothetical protein
MGRSPGRGLLNSSDVTVKAPGHPGMDGQSSSPFGGGLCVSKTLYPNFPWG